jgi:sugar phosphate isomerase/epimerase
MKLGIVADEIDRDFRNAVRVGTPVGLRRYEIRFLKSGRAPMCAIEELKEVERIAAGEGVEITALSPGLFKWTDEAGEFAKEMREVYPRAVEWARRWALPGLIVFGFHKPGATEETGPAIPSTNPPTQVFDWLAEAGRRAAEDGLRLMIEPEPVCWADSGTATAALTRRTGLDSLRINYDPANVAWVSRRDPLDEFDAVARSIANVHIKDLRLTADLGARPEFVVPGEGIINYRDHFARLRTLGFAGPFSLEPHMDGSAATIRRCKDAVERLWTEVT